jgi:hypothetical protein
MRWFAAALLLALATVAGAAEIRSLDLVKEDKVYRLLARVHVEAPQEAVFEVLNDYEGFPRLSSVFREGGIVEPIENGRGVVYIHMDACILFYCRDLKLVEWLEVEPFERMVVTVDPDRSDLEFGRGTWLLASDGQGTLLDYEVEMKPRFWIPPVLGPLVIKAVVRSRGIRAVRRLEYLASDRPIPEDLRVKN